MTCAECRDLLLDLAYGELPPERAAEVERHLADCAACREERAAIDRARRLVAPLRSLEEPSAAFDGRILAAARAEATMQADGTPGPVIDVAASVKPLGLQPARFDARAGVSVGQRPRRSTWMRRLAVGGSVAAAAGLAVVVGVSLRRPPLEVTEPVPELKVRAPVVSSAVDEAREKAKSPAAAAPGANRSPGSGGDVPVAAPAQVTPAPGAAPLLLPAPAPPAHKKADSRAASGGEPPAQPPPIASTAPSPAMQVPARNETSVPPASPSPRPPAVAGSAPPVAPSVESMPRKEVARERVSEAPSAAGRGNAAVVKEPEVAKGQGAAPAVAAKSAQQDSASLDAARADGPRGSEAAAERVARAQPTVEGAKVAARTPQTSASESMVAAPVDAEGVERSAETSRRAGRYEVAAQLYRAAATARRSAGDDTRAAWNLAHVVECLAAASLLEEAARARGELLRDYPGQDGPRRAADRALNYPAPPPEPGGR